MKITCVILLLGVAATARAQTDVYKIATEDPKKEVYATIIPIFDSDPQNENPYRIAIRDRANGKVWGSYVSWIDMMTEDAVRETTAVWSSTGDFIVFHMRPDRRSRVVRSYYIDRKHQRIREVKMPDYLQNMLGRLNRVSSPDHIGESAMFTSASTLLVKVEGSPQALSGTASVKLHGDPYSEPYGELLSVEVESEPAGAGQPATRPVDEPKGGDKPQPEAEGRSR